MVFCHARCKRTAPGTPKNCPHSALHNVHYVNSPHLERIKAFDIDGKARRKYMARASQTAGTPLLGTVVQVWTNVRTAATVWVCPKKPGHTHKPPIAKDWPVFLKGRPSSQKRSDGLAKKRIKALLILPDRHPSFQPGRSAPGCGNCKKPQYPQPGTEGRGE